MYRIIKTILILACIFQLSIAQEAKPEYSLLWEISGKDFKKPSYLFGSMHLNDPRIFNLPDSVLILMKEAEAFALELNIDTLSKLLSNEIVDKNGQFSNDDKDSEGDAFELFDPKGMPTFLDVYLYQIAKNLGKEHYGLEPSENQTSLDEVFDFDYKAFKESKEYDEMIDIYRAGNLAGIKSKTGSLEEVGYSDSISYKRNTDMTESIIRIGKNKSLFSVVGAMHLIEDRNILDQLKQAGYQVRKIGPFSNYSNFENEYNQRTKSEKLTHVEIGKYKVLGSSNMRTISSEETKDMDLAIDFDLPLGLMYMTMFFDEYVEDQNDLLENFYQSFIKEDTKVIEDKTKK